MTLEKKQVYITILLKLSYTFSIVSVILENFTSLLLAVTNYKYIPTDKKILRANHLNSFVNEYVPRNLQIYAISKLRYAN